MSEDKREVINLGREELDPEKEAERARYREQVRSAKTGVNALKGNEPVGVIPRPQMPDFGALQAARAAAHQAPSVQDGGVVARPAGSPVIRQETAEEIAAYQAALAKQNAEARQKAEEVKKTEEQDEKADDLFSSLNFDAIQNEADRIFNNKKRRLDIEGRCAPMDLEDLLLRDEVQQKVPIILGKYEVVFRSLTPEENLFIKRLMADEEVKTDQYIYEKFGLCQLACALVSLNGMPFPEHRGRDGSPDKKLFEEKLKKVSRKSGYLIADLSVNYAWFDLRVRKLLAPDALGNG